MCAAIAALALACGNNVMDDGGAAAMTAMATESIGAGDRAAALDTCGTVATAGGPWWNQAFAGQTKRFHVEFDATPSAVGLDAVIGLAGGAANGFTELAAIVRFNASGTIDVRDGDTYRATSSFSYFAGTTYHLRFDLDVRTHRYSVFLRFTGSEFYTAILRDAVFRTEQSGVTQLDDIAGKVDGDSGSIAICGLSVVADNTTADRCVVASAGDGFVTQAVSDQSVVGTVTFQATPSAPGIDGVIGWSAGEPATFDDLAAATRFAPSGVIDVRDGGGYRADFQRGYDARAFTIRMTSDLSSHTYSVFEGASFAFELARQYRFRTSQASVTHLDHVSVIIDSPTGSVTLCTLLSAASAGVTYSREGTYSVAPLPDGSSLISNASTVQRLDPGGRTVAQLFDAGDLAVDALGNVFVASTTNVTSTTASLFVRKYDPGFSLLWNSNVGVPVNSVIQRVTTDAGGDVLVGTASGSDGSVAATRFAPDGALVGQLPAAGTAIGFDGDQVLVGSNDPGTVRITRYNFDGSLVWSRSFTGRASVEHMMSDPQHRVLFGGELTDSIDFGGGALPVLSNPDSRTSAYFVLLSEAGDHVMSRAVGMSDINGLATNGDNIVVSGVVRTQLQHLALKQFGTNQRPLTTGLGVGGLNSEELGVGGRVVVGPTGRIWWNLTSNFPVLGGFP
ncbi:MAG TPA: hypothetical protein VLM79_21785, partial [Kofleriaceae bacterium]|nr:hypothetical protein [Kofleriaceae bacterium]